MKRLPLTIVLLLMVCMAMMAVPAKKGVYKTLKLAGGQEVRAMLVGDEYGSFWKGSDGKAYVLNGDCYEPVDEKTVLEKANVRRAKANVQYAKRLPKARGIGDFPGYYGKRRIAVILVNYGDVAFQEGHDNALYQRIFNEENFREEPFVGSVSDYFRDQSNGLFTLNFDIFGPVTLSKERAYYGRHYNDNRDMHPAEMAIEAVNLVKDMVEDWHQYDWDGDGEVDLVYLIYAGCGEDSNGIEEEIWPHKSDLKGRQIDGDGTGPVKVDEHMVVNTYACSSELVWDNQLSGIGAICHEFSHCLGLPDFYDVFYSGGQGLNFWDIMADGSQLANYFHPAGYSSYERWKAGWLEPIVLESGDTTITDMEPLQNGGECYIIYNKGNRNEYFLLENRQYTNWDACLPSRGLMILHVDEDDKIWRQNKINTDYYHQRMTWVPANGLYETVFQMEQRYVEWWGLKNDLFPSDDVNAFNRSFKTYDNQSKRAAWLFYPNADGTHQIDSSIENITQNADGTISFNFVAAYSGEIPEEASGTVHLEDITGYYVARDGTTLTGRKDRIMTVIDDGATVTLQGATILGTNEENLIFAGITCLGDATIILASGTENSIRGFQSNYPGIYVPKGMTLTIKGDGQLTASSNGNGAGIGGGASLSCGNIRIEGGTINAQGGTGAAGIGGGNCSACGDITITADVTSVTASTEGKSNSIGAGYGNGEDFAPCGTVTIGGVETGSISETPYTYIPTHIKPVTADSSTDQWYMLDGRRLQGQPSRKGIYIRNGKKVIISH